MFSRLAVQQLRLEATLHQKLAVQGEPLEEIGDVLENCFDGLGECFLYA